MDNNYDIHSFYLEFSSLENISYKEIIKKIALLNKQDRKEVLSNEKIRDKLKIDILEGSNEDFYKGFDDILHYLSVEEFISLYDLNTLDNYYQGSYTEYIFFASCAKKDINGLFRSIIDKDDMLERCLKLSDAFCSLFSNLNYDLYKEIVFKKEDKVKQYLTGFYNRVSEENQHRILQEDLKDETIVTLVDSFSEKVINDFFKNNKKALYLYDKFSIPFYASRGISFNTEILKKKKFFNKLKLASFVDFRTIINKLEENNNVDIIEKHVNDYYEELINSYNPNTGLFKQYEEMIKTYDGEIQYTGNLPFITKDGTFQLTKHIDLDKNNKRYIKDPDKLNEELKTITSNKISEVLSDILFKDNFNNVCLNLKEMLRYNKKLSDKVIDMDKEEFYQMILNLDKVSSNDKLKLISQLKNKHMDFMFYEDLRKLKDISYKEINKKLYNVNNDVYNYREELSNQYGVKIFDLREQEYTMLIRSQHSFNEISPRKNNSYSLISNENNIPFQDFVKSNFQYGYNSFKIDTVAHVLEEDSYSMDEEQTAPSRFVNRIMDSDEIINSNGSYSEIVLTNNKNKERGYDNIKPDFVISYNNIHEREIEEAKRLNIPLVIIKKKELKSGKKTDITFDKDTDVYISNFMEESNLKIAKGQ